MISGYKTIKGAKAAATREFGGEFLDYCIVILDDDVNLDDRVVASKHVSAKRWPA